MREDNQLLVITHSLQLLTIVTGFGGLLVPLVLWLTQRDKVFDMEEHGRAIINFQLSLILYSFICIPLIFLIVGIFGLVILGIIGLVFPIINAVNASNGRTIYYPISIPFLGAPARRSNF